MGIHHSETVVLPDNPGRIISSESWNGDHIIEGDLQVPGHGSYGALGEPNEPTWWGDATLASILSLHEEYTDLEDNSGLKGLFIIQKALAMPAGGFAWMYGIDMEVGIPVEADAGIWHGDVMGIRMQVGIAQGDEISTVAGMFLDVSATEDATVNDVIGLGVFTYSTIGSSANMIGLQVGLNHQTLGPTGQSTGIDLTQTLLDPSISYGMHLHQHGEVYASSVAASGISIENDVVQPGVNYYMIRGEPTGDYLNVYGLMIEGKVAGGTITVAEDFYGVYVDAATDASVTGDRYAIYALGPTELIADTSVTVPLEVKGAGSQSANLSEWRSSADALLAALTSAGVVISSVPDSSPSDATLPNGTFRAYVDQSGNLLKFRVRYSDGTLKTGQVALT